MLRQNSLKKEKQKGKRKKKKNSEQGKVKAGAKIESLRMHA
jgi:hypothetical protein